MTRNIALLCVVTLVAVMFLTTVSVAQTSFLSPATPVSSRDWQVTALDTVGEWSATTMPVTVKKVTPLILIGCYIKEDDTVPEFHRIRFLKSTDAGRSWTIVNIANDAMTDATPNPGCGVTGWDAERYALIYQNATYEGASNEAYTDDTSQAIVFTTNDGGSSWTRRDPWKSFFGSGGEYGEQPGIAAVQSSRTSGVGYAVFACGESSFNCPLADEWYLSKTTDFGVTWEDPIAIDYSAAPSEVTNSKIITSPQENEIYFSIDATDQVAQIRRTLDDGSSFAAIDTNTFNYAGFGMPLGQNVTGGWAKGSTSGCGFERTETLTGSASPEVDLQLWSGNRCLGRETQLSANNASIWAIAGLYEDGTDFDCPNECPMLLESTDGGSNWNVELVHDLAGEAESITSIAMVNNGLDGYAVLWLQTGADGVGGLYSAQVFPTVSQVNNATGFTRITKVETDYENTPTVYVRDNGGTSGDSTISKFTANLASGFEATECVSPYQESGFVEVGLVVTTDDIVGHPCEVDPDDDDFFFNSVILGRNRNLGQEIDVETCNRATDISSTHSHRVAWISQSQFLNDNCADDDEELFGVVSLVTGAQVCNGATAVGQAIRVSTSAVADTRWFFTHGSGGLSQYSIDQCTLQGGDSNIGGFGVAHLPYNRGDPTNLSDDGEVVAHDSGNDEIVHYNVTVAGELEVLERINVGEGTPYHSVLGLSGSKDGAYFLSWTTDNVTLWVTETDQVVLHIEWGPQDITDLIRWAEMDVLNNNLYLANDTEVRVYDVSALTSAFGVDNEGPNTGPDPFSNPFTEQETGQQAADADTTSAGSGGGTGQTQDLFQIPEIQGIFGGSGGNTLIALLLILAISYGTWVTTNSGIVTGGAVVGSFVFVFDIGLMPEWVIFLVFALVAILGIALFTGMRGGR